MARQVYYDPFGSFAQGYDSGVQREMSMQKGMREARTEDFNYNYMLPLRYNEAKRQDDLGQFSLPFQKELIPIGVANAKNNLYNTNLAQSDELARRTGVTAPMEQYMGQRFNLSFQPGQPTYDTNAVAARDTYLATMEGLLSDPTLQLQPAEIEQLKRDNAMAIASQYGVPPEMLMGEQPIAVQQPSMIYMMTPDGRQVPVGNMPNMQEGLRQYVDRTYTGQQQQLDWARQYQLIQALNQQRQTDAYRYSTDTYGNRGAGTASGGETGSGWEF